MMAAGDPVEEKYPPLHEPLRPWLPDARWSVRTENERQEEDQSQREPFVFERSREKGAGYSEPGGSNEGERLGPRMIERTERTEKRDPPQYQPSDDGEPDKPEFGQKRHRSIENERSILSRYSSLTKNCAAILQSAGCCSGMGSIIAPERKPTSSS